MKNKLIDEISATLMQIQRTNQMIAYHQQFKDIDEQAVANFTRLRKDFLEQLDGLMKELNLKVDLREAA